MLQYINCIKFPELLVFQSVSVDVKQNKRGQAGDKIRVFVKNKRDGMVNKEEKWFSDVYVTFSFSLSFNFFYIS